jgi:hypothetical protein
MIRVLAIALVIAVTAPAWADKAPPWATGVPAERQDRANALFTEGNQLFTQLAHAPALEKYKAAIALWDHPMIRFNMAVTMVRLDRMLEAAEQLEAALRYGAKPFTTELYQQALDYQNLVNKQLGHIEVTCVQPDTQILLDGKPWFTSPGTKTIRVAAGEHVVVAERKGYMTESRRIMLAGGANTKEKIALVPIESAVILDYPYPRWLPWTFAGTGAAVALGGLGFWLLGKNELDEFQREFVSQCPAGCEADLASHPGLADMQASALRKGDIGVTMMLAGGALTIGGLVWTLANRPTRRLPEVEVMPTRDGMAARAAWRF